MKDRSFGVLQRIGRSFMLPIALLPVAGLFLGIGSSFTNPTTLNAYGLTGLIHEGNFLYTVLDILSRAGNAVFANLPLLFAIGVSIGMAKREKEVAALSSVIAYLIMNTVISALIAARGGVEAMAPNTTESNLGITTLTMGVFGGIIVGIGVAWLHNRFYNIELPKVLSFFGGTRFVPIISSIVYLFVGALMFFVWPIVQSGIAWLGNLVLASGYAGTWIYGIIERALIPFGLHHVFYVPFWQTSIGGTAIIDGVVINGAQNIFFAELASKATEVFSVSATRFMSGKFPFMIFGLPGAALALYKTALPEKRKLVGSLLVSAALTSVLTGITEPLEFTFLFAAPLLYAVHCVLAGLSYMLMHIFGVGVGMTFSGGLIDLFLFGILQGNAKTNWIWIVVVGIIYFFVYYLLFKFMIKKFNYRTPGRFADEEETKLYTRKDLQKGKNDFAQSKLILEGLGGKNNIADIDCCATRLRVTLKNPELANEVKLKESGASGVIKKGDGIQVIYGPIVSNVKSNLENYIESHTDTHEEDTSDKGKCEILFSPLNGKIVPLENVSDSAFSSLAMGNGVAIEPSGNVLVAPCDGTVKSVFPTGHAVTFVTDSGAEILMHIGIDTVKLKGKHFEKFVVGNQHVKKGQKLISFDLEQIKKEGYKAIVPIVICNTASYKSIVTLKTGTISRGDKLLKLE
ncbi:MAG: PTS transporter subunit EIIC [Clostridia bacterium]|nr:PTS transporter subunit EIIC [Clostridia bacterium]